MDRISSELRSKAARAEDVARNDPDVVAAAQGVGLLGPKGDYIPLARSNARSWIESQWSQTVGRQG